MKPGGEAVRINVFVSRMAAAGAPGRRVAESGLAPLEISADSAGLRFSGSEPAWDGASWAACGRGIAISSPPGLGRSPVWQCAGHRTWAGRVPTVVAGTRRRSIPEPSTGRSSRSTARAAGNNTRHPCSSGSDSRGLRAWRSASCGFDSMEMLRGELVTASQSPVLRRYVESWAGWRGSFCRPSAESAV